MPTRRPAPLRNEQSPKHSLGLLTDETNHRAERKKDSPSLVFTVVNGGAMVQATVGGQKFSFKPIVST